MGRYVKRRVEIEAIQYWGDNLAEVLEFTGKHPSWDQHFADFDAYAAHVAADGQRFKIITLEGVMDAFPGDWIIRGVKGEFYPCKPDIFAATYDEVGDYDLIGGVRLSRSGFDFGLALHALKQGAKVRRRGWNGKGMWIALTPGSAFEAKHAKCGHAAAKRAVELDDPEAEIELLPHIDMRAADGSMVIGWLASQTDMLAEDWEVV